MIDLLSIATFAADQIPCDLPRIAGLDVHYVVGIHGPIVEIELIYREGPGVMKINREDKPVSRTAEIMKAARAADAAHAARQAEKAAARAELTPAQRKALPSPLPRIRPALATAAGRADASSTATLLLRGTEDVLDRNNVKRDHSLPRRALSMASSRGRVTPDGLASVMAFFSNPSHMAEGMLASFLPTKVGVDQAKALLADPFVVDVVEGTLKTFGLGALPTPAEAVKAVKNPATGRSGGAPGRLHIADGKTPATIPTGKRGRPSGPKYVDYLVPTADACEAAALLLTGPRPTYGCVNLSEVPGGNDVAQGTGQGYGCEVWTDGRMGWAGNAPTPAQVNRRNADLDAYHAAEAKAHAERLAAEQAE